MPASRIRAVPRARDTIVDRFFERARERPDGDALHFRRDGRWVAMTWGEYVRQARRFGQALIARGVGTGTPVAILARNRPEWLVADLGAMAAGCVPAGIYPNASAEQAAWIVRHSGSPILVVEDAAQWQRVAPFLRDLPGFEGAVVLDPAGVDDPRTVPFADFLAEGDGREADLDDRADALADDDLATLIYTSGTTGPPKGAMLSHRNLAWTAGMARDIVARSGVPVRPDDRVISYLPLCHIAEQLFSIHLPVTGGYTVWFAGGLESLRDDLLSVRPTLFLGVPRVWEKLHAALAARFAGARGARAALLGFALAAGREAGEAWKRGRRPGGIGALRHAAADRLVLGKVRRAIGLDRARLCVSGSAPIGRDVLEFFLALGLPLHEVYGQSEGTGVATFNLPGETVLGTVGRPVPGVDVVLAQDGEIRVRGPNVFLGYFRDPAATAECLHDGWLSSGDVGEFTPDGHLRITDRKKDLIIPSGGKNVAPQNLERQVREIDLVSQCVVVGDGRPYLVALLTLAPDAAAAFARERGLPADGTVLAGHPAVREALAAGIEEVNGHNARCEAIRRFEVLPGEFTVEGGEFTPTLKVRRRAVAEKYADVVARLYGL